MAQMSRPWTGVVTGDAGAYSAAQWAEIYKYLAGANDANTGPLIGSGTAPDMGLTVNAQGTPAAAVDVTTGAAAVQGTFYLNDATVTLAVAANGSGNPRIDTVILRKDTVAQTVRLALLQGSPAASPVPPTLTQTVTTYEIPLADIAVASGFVTIVQGNITPRRYFANAADGVYVLDVKNNSGGSLQTGDVVIWDTTSDRSVTTTTTASHSLTAGVWVGFTASAGYGRVLVRGIGFVRTDAAVAARGTVLTTGTTAKLAGVTAISALYTNELGISLQTTSGAGLCLTYLHVRRVLNTNTSGAANVPIIISADDTEVTISNTVVDTTMYSHTLIGGTLGIHDSIKVDLDFNILNNSGAVRTYNFLIKYGATTLMTLVVTMTAGATVGGGKLSFMMKNVSATNSQKAVGHVEIGSAGSWTADIDYGTAAENSALDKTVAVSLTMGVATATQTVVQLNAVMTYIKAT